MSQTQRPLLILALLLAVSGCNCDPEDVGVAKQLLVPIPEAIDYGTVPIRFGTPRDLVLRNDGEVTATLESFTVSGTGADAFVAPDLPANPVLRPGQEVILTVLFDPQDAKDYEASLTVASSLTDDVVVPLSGTAEEPDIELCYTPPAGSQDLNCAAPGENLVLDFGTVVKNAEPTMSFLVRNVGLESLHVADEGTALAPGTAEAGWSPEASLSGATIIAGGGVEVGFRFLGKEQGAVTGQLAIATNDPDEPIVYVDLKANGAVNQKPTACAAVSKIEHQDTSEEIPADPTMPLARPADRLFFTAHPTADCSKDPEDGTVLTYDWKVVQRPLDDKGNPLSIAAVQNGSSGPAPGSTQQAPYLEIDAIGTYVVELIVRDALGAASDPAQVTINAIPKDDITVEVTWREGADMDVHLLAPGGQAFCSPLDCYWDTCLASGAGGTGVPVLDWGSDGTSIVPDSDKKTDPLLVFDNQGATQIGGSDVRLENIRLPIAPIVSGTPYTVVVHYFEDKGVVANLFDVTVRVVYQGTILLDQTHTFNAADQGRVWVAGQVDIENGTGTPVNDLSQVVLGSDVPGNIVCN